MNETYRGCYESEIGVLEIVGMEDGISTVRFVDEKPAEDASFHPHVKECIRQLDEYFRGKRKTFSVELLLRGTDFQKKVWKELMKIPFGQTVSYKDIASAIGNVRAFRAVGNANGRNRIPIIIPCHRVIAHNGDLAGYGSGVWRKAWLLQHERNARFAE